MSNSEFNSFLKILTVFFMSIPLLSSSPALAAKREKGPEVVVMRPADLPPTAQIAGQSMYLRAVGFSRYLYIEQDYGKRLAVFDVARPAHIKTATVISLNAPKFVFLQAITSKLVLLRLDSPEKTSELGILDIKHPKSPRLRRLGEAEFEPITPATPQYMQAMPQVKGINDVRQEINDKDLGSSFVLTGEGLWIIRHPAVEEDFELRELQFYAD